MAPFCWASPPLVVVRLMPSETSNTWKMMIMPISPISMATISSTMLKPREAERWRDWGMARSLDEDRHDRHVTVRRQAERGLLREQPENLDLDRRPVRRCKGRHRGGHSHFWIYGSR